MKNFIKTHEDLMATLDEIIAHFNNYKIYFICEDYTPSAIRDVVVIDDNKSLVASFIEWDDDDGEPCVYTLTEHTPCTLDDVVNEYIAYGFYVEATQIN